MLSFLMSYQQTQHSPIYKGKLKISIIIFDWITNKLFTWHTPYLVSKFDAQGRLKLKRKDEVERNFALSMKSPYLINDIVLNIETRRGKRRKEKTI